MIIIKETTKLPLIWYSVVKNKIDTKRPLWMGADAKKLEGMATSVNNYYKILISSTTRLFDYRNTKHIDNLVDKIMPCVNATETLGEWAYLEGVSIPIPMHKVFEAVESGDQVVYNAPNIQKAIKSLGFDGLTCLELNSLTCYLWNTTKISSIISIPKP